MPRSGSAGGSGLRLRGRVRQQRNRRGSLRHLAGGGASRGPPCFHSIFTVAPTSRVGAETRAPAPLPTSFASTDRIVATSPTPGTLRAAAAAPLGIGEKPSLFWITRPPAKFSSTTWATELFSPAAKTVTKVTRARPIINAAAVTAVRLGLRCAFSRARRPISRRRRSSGQPDTAASAGTRRGLKSETAKTMTTAPPPIRPAAVPPPALPKSPNRTIARPAAPSRTETAPRIKRRRRVAGGTYACRAAIGGTRVERSAGTSEERTVTTSPTRSETTIVRDSITRLVVGRSTSKSLSRALSMRAARKPPATPIAAPISPIAKASTTTAVRICGATRRACAASRTR